LAKQENHLRQAHLKWLWECLRLKVHLNLNCLAASLCLHLIFSFIFPVFLSFINSNPLLVFAFLSTTSTLHHIVLIISASSAIPYLLLNFLSLLLIFLRSPIFLQFLAFSQVLLALQFLFSAPTLPVAAIFYFLLTHLLFIANC